MWVGSLFKVSPTLAEIGAWPSSIVRKAVGFFLFFDPKGFEVVKDRVQIASHLQLGQLRKDFFHFAVPGLNNIVAELAKLLCATFGGLKGLLKGFFPFRNPLVSVGEAFWATVPNTAVVLKPFLTCGDTRR